MRLTLRDVSLGRAVLWDFRNRLPPGVCSITWDGSFASVYSADNPNLLLDLAGFEMRILPVFRAAAANGGDGADGGAGASLLVSDSSWPLRHYATREVTAVAHVQVTQDGVERIKNRLRAGLISLGHATFERIARRWNGLVTELVPYYREAILGTAGLQAEAGVTPGATEMAPVAAS
jgi:pre-mRNA-processing factor 8